MKILFYLILITVLNSTEVKEKILTVKDGKILFTSIKDEETIKGIGKLASGKIDFQNKKISVKFDLSDFRTTNSLQTKHLHDNYLETEKFPIASYEGEIKSYNPSSGESVLNGVMQIHGVSKKDFLTKGILKKTKDGYFFESEFLINLNDFKIEIPKLLILKINENIQAKTSFNLGGVE